MIYFSKQLNLISLNHSSSLIKENESLNQKCKVSECERQVQVSYDFKERPLGLRETGQEQCLELDWVHWKPITRMDHSQQPCLENLSILFPNKWQAWGVLQHQLVEPDANAGILWLAHLLLNIKCVWRSHKFLSILWRISWSVLLFRALL